MRIYAPPPLMKNSGLIRVHQALLPPPPTYLIPVFVPVSVPVPVPEPVPVTRVAKVSLPPEPLHPKLPKETGTYMFRGATGSVPTWEFVIRDTR